MIRFIFLMLLSFAVSAADIRLTWVQPELREDGSAIETIDRFNIYQTFNNSSTTIIEVDSDLSSYEVLDAETGSYTFQISTVELGREGQKSDPITATIAPASIAPIAPIAPPQKITISGNNLTIEVIE